MRILLQRVHHASVEVDQSPVGVIEKGLLLFVGLGQGDSATCFPAAIKKVLTLRVFENENGKFDQSLTDIGGGALLIPQFTLYGQTRKGRRPDFTQAMPPEQAKPLFEDFFQAFSQQNAGKTAQGVFGAHMNVALINDGPVTLMLEFDS